MDVTYTLNLGATKAGLTDLQAQLIDAEGVDTGSPVTTGYTDLGSGAYQWTLDIPATHRGSVEFSSASQSWTIVLAVNPLTEATASTEPDTITAYLYTRNGSGVITAGMIVGYRLRAMNGVGGGYDDDTLSVTSDSNGLAQIPMIVNGTYQYWLESGRPRTITITAAMTNPYELPAVKG